MRLQIKYVSLNQSASTNLALSINQKHIEIEDDVHEEYVKMVLSPKDGLSDLKINEYIIDKMLASNIKSKKQLRKTFRM